MEPFRTAVIVALSMLDPALAWILFAWKRALQFGGDRDWVLASPQKAGEFRCESTSMLENQVEPAAKAAQFGNDVGWHTFRHYAEPRNMPNADGTTARCADLQINDSA